MNSKSVIGALLIALGLLSLGLTLSNAIKSFSNRDRTVDVRGLAEREVAANKVTWPIVYKLVGNDLPTLYGQVNATNARIAQFLTSNGVDASAISYNAPQLYDLQADRYNNQPVPFRYNITNVITVVSSDVERITGLIKRQGELLKEGIALTNNDYSNQIIYEYTGLNDIKPAMIAEATENAREAAKKFAEDSQSKIGKIRSARQGQFSIEDRDPYTPDIKRVRVVTSLTYYLED